MATVTYNCTGCVVIDRAVIDAYNILTSTEEYVSSAESDRATAEAARVLAEQERTRVFAADHGTATDDHATAVSDHGIAGDDHLLAVADHGTAGDDHTLAAGDHVTAGEDHLASTSATSRANDAAAAAEHMVDIHQGPPGADGTGITEIEQTVTSHANGGQNTVQIRTSDGNSYNVYIKNGSASNGLFPTSSALNTACPSPAVGDFAYVGSGFPADIYVCQTAGTWVDSGEDYDGDNVDLTDYATKAEVTQLEAKVDNKCLLITGYDYTTTFGITTGSNVNTTVVGYNDNKAIPVAMKAGDVVKLSMNTNLVDYVTLYIRKLGASSYTSTNKYLYANGTLEYTATDDIISLGFYRAAAGVTGSGDLSISAHIDGDLTGIRQDITQLQTDLGAAVATIPAIVDNCTTEDATKGLSAKQGVVLDGKIKDTQTEVRTKIDGLYESRSFKSGVDGVSFSQYFDTPADKFILRVNQIVGSTEKMLIQRIDGNGVASNYANNQPLDTDIEISIDKSAYPQMRVYAGSSYGEPTYTQDETDFLLLVKTTLPGVREKTNELTERELKLDGKHIVRTLSVTSGTGVSNIGSATPGEFDEGEIVKFTMATSCVDYLTIYFKKKGESSWTSSGLYLYANRTPLYATIPYDIEAISFYRAAAGVTATGLVVINIGKYGDLDKANNLLGKKIVMFGDSITQLPNTGNTRGLGIPEFFEMFTGAKVYRIAIGGTKLSRSVATLPASVQSASDASNCIQICSIVEGMATGDLTRQATAINDYIGDTFTKDVTLPLMESIDLNDVDIVTIFGGTNDCTSGIALGTASDENPTTIYGAINFMVKKLLTAYPRLKVFVFTPIVRQYTPNNPATWSDDYTPNGAGIYLYEYADKIVEASKKNHIPVCDLYYGMGWTRYNFATFCTDADKTHPRNGFDALAEKMSAFISANL